MDELDYLTDTATQVQLRDYPPALRTEPQALRIPPDIAADMLRMALENGYGSLQAFIEDMCISTTLQWRERQA